MKTTTAKRVWRKKKFTHKHTPNETKTKTKKNAKVEKERRVIIF